MAIDVGLAPIPTFKGRLTAPQTITAANAWTAVALNNPRFTAPRPCSLLVSAHVLWDAGASATTSPRRVIAVWKNGVGVAGGSSVDGSPDWQTFPSANDYFGMNCPTVPVDLATGEFLELGVYTALAGAKLTGDTSGTGAVMTVWERAA